MEKFNIEEVEQAHQVTVMEIVNADELKKKAGDSDLVYVLTANDQAIVLGRGKKDRAKIILDRIELPPTKVHYKSMFVRMYQILEPQQKYRSYIVRCANVNEAKRLESTFHSQYGGEGKFDSNGKVDEFVKNCDETVKLLLKLAYHSSFSGLSDLYKWQKEGLVSPLHWDIILKKLML